ncbi:hypothetical protein FKB33_05885 [Enterococcus faecium]|nr:hypothetical protein [Enterococcus faecium]
MIAISGVTIVLELGQLDFGCYSANRTNTRELYRSVPNFVATITLVALFVIMFLIYLIVPNAQLKLKTIIPA